MEGHQPNGRATVDYAIVGRSQDSSGPQAAAEFVLSEERLAELFARARYEGDGRHAGSAEAGRVRLLVGLQGEELDEAVVLLGVGDVGEGVGVEGFEEALERFAQRGFEAADGDDGASVGFDFEALDDFEIRFAGTDDVAEADLRGWLGEGDAARTAGGGGDEMVGGEGLDHADEMVL